jgi:hypothetical protein
MPRRGGSVHVVTTQRRYKGRVYRTHLLRRSYRENGKVKNETLGNLSHLPEAVIDLIRRALRGEPLVGVDERFSVVRSPHHGHVVAVLTAMRRLGLAGLLASRPSRERSLCSRSAARLLWPTSKLATSRWWHPTTLPELLGVRTRARTTSTRRWTGCSSARGRSRKARGAPPAGGRLRPVRPQLELLRGHALSAGRAGQNRDGRRDSPGEHGLLADREGRPWRTSGLPGNTSDPKTCCRRWRRCASASACGR